MGNTNNKKNVSKEEELEILMYKELENNPKVNQDELHLYGVPAQLLDQDQRIVRQLHDLVSIYNRMGATRRRYIFKTLHGAYGKEMSLMSKKITVDKECAKSLVDDIHTAKGHCPPVPAIFNDLPKLI